MAQLKSPKHYTTKAVLLSAFVFPGLGLWWLKQYLRACIFIVPAGAALGYMLHTMGKVYLSSLSELQAEGDGILFYDMPRLIQHITQVIMKHLDAYNSNLHTLEMIFLAAWLCGIVSTFFVAQQRDQAEQAKKLAQEQAE